MKRGCGGDAGPVPLAPCRCVTGPGPDRPDLLKLRSGSREVDRRESGIAQIKLRKEYPWDLRVGLQILSAARGGGPHALAESKPPPSNFRCPIEICAERYAQLVWVICTFMWGMFCAAPSPRVRIIQSSKRI